MRIPSLVTSDFTSRSTSLLSNEDDDEGGGADVEEGDGADAGGGEVRLDTGFVVAMMSRSGKVTKRYSR
jgi:hypothetical protein